MTPPTPRLQPIPLPVVHGNPPSYSPILPSPPTSSVVDLHLNPLLRPSFPRRLYYDVTLPPCTIILDGPYALRTLTKPATTPPVTYFRIIPATVPVWPVMVFNSDGVTVYDVLYAIYHSLHTPLSPSAWDDLDIPHLGTTPPPMLRSRSQDVPRTLGSTPLLEGNRRVDRLQGHTWFFGLEKGPEGPDSWILRTAK